MQHRETSSATPRSSTATFAKGAARRIGASLVRSGLSALSVSALEGLSRRGKIGWWTALSLHARAIILMAFALVADMDGTSRRKAGLSKFGNELGAAAVAAWTLAMIYLAECLTDEGVLGIGSLSSGDDDTRLTQLATLDQYIDEEIWSAVERLCALAEDEFASLSRLARRGIRVEASCAQSCCPDQGKR